MHSFLAFSTHSKSLNYVSNNGITDRNTFHLSLHRNIELFPSQRKQRVNTAEANRTLQFGETNDRFLFPLAVPGKETEISL